MVGRDWGEETATTGRNWSYIISDTDRSVAVIRPECSQADRCYGMFEWHCVSFSALAVFSRKMRYTNRHFTYLLTLTVRQPSSVLSCVSQTNGYSYPRNQPTSALSVYYQEVDIVCDNDTLHIA